MSKSTLILIFLIGCSAIISAQKYDYNWLMGYGGKFDSTDSLYGLNHLDFNQFPMEVDYLPYGVMDFSENAITMSDEQGNILFLTNGVEVHNVLHELMENGDSITPPSEYLGLRAPQNIFSVPYPGSQDSFLLIYHDDIIHWYNGFDYLIMSPDLRYAVIDMTENDGLGAVVSKHNVVVQDTFASEMLTACKHANGRDWWVLLCKRKVNELYHILVDPNGVNLMYVDTIQKPFAKGLGQACFAPDGSKYAILNLYTTDEMYLDIFDFDRCTGKLSNQIQLKYNIDWELWAGGLAISQNSRFLYVNLHSKIFQYDLLAEDVISSEKIVAEYDGFLDPFPTRFYLSQLAPDGRIYTNSNNGVRSMHVIEHPNRADTACKVNQHSFPLISYNGFSMPNHPYYRLGPIDGSECDTLGIDNIPLANFRYDIDTLHKNHVEFTDLSDYEPSDYYWNFGDGKNSTEQHPFHFYENAGVYDVCLKVSNGYGQDSLCRSLRVDQVSTVQMSPKVNSVEWTIYPNPTSDLFHIEYDQQQYPDMTLKIYDSIGRVRGLYRNLKSVDTNGLEAGLYFIEFWSDGRGVGTKRFVKL